MAILDTFVSIFEADTESLEKGYSSSKKKTDDLSDSLKKTEEQANKTTSSMITLAKRAAAFFAASMIANASVKATIERATEVESLYKFSDAVGDSIENVDAFARSMQRLGVDRREAEQGLASIYANMSKVGISADSATEAMYKLSDKVSQLDPKKAKEYLAIVGITDPRIVDAMMKGRSSLDQMMHTQKEAGVTTKESAENAMAFNAALGRLGEGADKAKSKIGDALSPVFTFLLEILADLVDWANEHEVFILSFFTALATVIGIMLLPTVISLAASVWALIAPFLVVIAIGIAVAAIIALIVDDIYNFIQGNDSLIGSLLEKYPIIGKVFSAIWEILKSFWAFMVEIFKGIVNLPNTLINFGSDLKEKFKEPIESIKQMFLSLWEFVKDIFSGITDAFNSIQSGWNSVKSFFGFGSDDVEVKKEITLNSDKSPAINQNNIIENNYISDDSVEEKTDYIDQSKDEHLSQYFDKSDYIITPYVVSETAKEGATQLTEAEINPYNATSSQTLNRREVRNDTKINVGDINITTSANPDDVISAINDTLSEQLEQLAEEYNTELAR